MNILANKSLPASRIVLQGKFPQIEFLTQKYEHFKAYICIYRHTHTHTYIYIAKSHSRKVATRLNLCVQAPLPQNSNAGIIFLKMANFLKTVKMKKMTSCPNSYFLSNDNELFSYFLTSRISSFVNCRLSFFIHLITRANHPLL